jgi:hypothetical protein
MMDVVHKHTTYVNIYFDHLITFSNEVCIVNYSFHLLKCYQHLNYAY